MKEKYSLGLHLANRCRAAGLGRSELACAMQVPDRIVVDWMADNSLPQGHYRERLFELFPHLDRELPVTTHTELRHQLYALISQLGVMEMQALADIVRVRFLAKRTGR